MAIQRLPNRVNENMEACGGQNFQGICQRLRTKVPDNSVSAREDVGSSLEKRGLPWPAEAKHPGGIAHTEHVSLGRTMGSQNTVTPGPR